jgi:integrase
MPPLKLLASARVGRKALWATALYAGLRKGELRALTWEDIDLDQGLIRVERSMDGRGRLIAPKSKAGRRTVPLATTLRAFPPNSAWSSGIRRLGHVRHGVPPAASVSLASRASHSATNGDAPNWANVARA